MKTAPDHPWPPVITTAKVSWLIRARDWFLTMLAWLTLAFMLRLGLLLLWDYFSDPIFELTRVKAPDWGLMWQRLFPFVCMILVVVYWIIAWGVGRRRPLRRSFDPRVTPSLPLEEHAASLELDPREVERWRQWRSVTVHFDGSRIASAQPRTTADADPENLP